MKPPPVTVAVIGIVLMSLSMLIQNQRHSKRIEVYKNIIEQQAETLQLTMQFWTNHYRLRHPNEEAYLNYQSDRKNPIPWEEPAKAP